MKTIQLHIQTDMHSHLHIKKVWEKRMENEIVASEFSQQVNLRFRIQAKKERQKEHVKRNERDARIRY